jgi:hypothetical protein
MKRSGISLFAATLLVTAAMTLAYCGGSGSQPAANSQPAAKSPDTSSDAGPAPDNNSANNPSLADTAYEKNRTRPITDTAHPAPAASPRR